MKLFVFLFEEISLENWFTVNQRPTDRLLPLPPLLSLVLSLLVCLPFARSCAIYEANRFTLFANLGFTKNVDFCVIHRWEPNLHHYPDELAAFEVSFPRGPWVLVRFYFSFPLLTRRRMMHSRVFKTNVLGARDSTSKAATRTSLASAKWQTVRALR